MLLPSLPVTVTHVQLPLSSVPEVNVLESLNCKIPLYQPSPAEVFSNNRSSRFL